MGDGDYGRKVREERDMVCVYVCVYAHACTCL